MKNLSYFLLLKILLFYGLLNFIMQAKLPDVNAALVRHRNAIMNAYDGSDFSKASISFDAILALLPEDYRPEVNTIKYEELVEAKRLLICDHCKTETPRQNVIPYRLLLSSIDSIISGQQIIQVWQCPKCKRERPLKDSRIKTMKWEQPVYFKVIPEPPNREGFHDRIGFIDKFKKWYDVAFREIEYQIGLYRTEYARQEDSVMDVMPDE